MYSADTSVYTDFQGLAKLRTAAQKDAGDALEETAQQFEAVMMQLMLKSMRQASAGEEMMDSDQSLFYRDMYDQQIAIHLAKSGGLGLADVIKRQLGGVSESVQPPSKVLSDYRQQAMMAVPVSKVSSVDKKIKPNAVTIPPLMNKSSMPSTAATTPLSDASDPAIDSPASFLKHLWPMAQEAAILLGQEPDTLLAQAALETGWGQKMIRTGGGTNSFNLFGIKADQRWSGDKAIVPTLEYEEGVAVRQKAAFRVYSSFADSFNDYAAFLQSDPRYQPALQADDGMSYLSSLQEAGYATDPRYAEKIKAILDRPETKQILVQLKSAK